MKFKGQEWPQRVLWSLSVLESYGWCLYGVYRTREDAMDARKVEGNIGKGRWVLMKLVQEHGRVIR